MRGASQAANPAHEAAPFKSGKIRHDAIELAAAESALTRSKPPRGASRRNYFHRGLATTLSSRTSNNVIVICVTSRHESRPRSGLIRRIVSNGNTHARPSHDLIPDPYDEYFFTMSIEVFCRLRLGPTNPAEQLVLQRLISILTRRGDAAVILTNMLLGPHEIDLFVATETTTLVIEVKGYRQPVAGKINDKNWVMLTTGESLSNAYEQAHSASLALKDALRASIGADPGYAHAVVLFAYGKPRGSILPSSDHRVTLKEIDDLDALLSTPIPPTSKRRIWDMACVRSYAIRKGLTRVNWTAAAAPTARMQWIEPKSGNRVLGVSDRTVIEDAVSTVVVEPQGRHHAPRPAGRRAGLGMRKTIWSVAGLAAAMFAASIWLRHTPAVPNGQQVASNAMRHPPASKLPRRHRHSAGTVARASHPEDGAPPDTTLDAPAIAAPIISAAPLPPCPKGIDRLGCVPDQETLAKLRN